MIKDKTLLIQALKLFCSKDEYRMWMLAPRLCGEYIIATDAFTLAWLPYNKIELVYPCSDPVPEANKSRVLDLMNGDRNTNTTYKISLINHMLEWCICTVPVEHEIECDLCDGDGEVAYEFYSSGYDASKLGDCPKCDGSGKVSVNKEGETTEALSDLIPFKVGVAYIRPTLIKQLSTAAEILGESEIQLIHQYGKCEASVFIVGELTIALMPVDQLEGNCYDFDGGIHIVKEGHEA